MKIYYGVINNLVDVTDICIQKLLENNIITIPAGDFYRANFFGDHIFGKLKSVFIQNNDDDYNNKVEYYDFYIIKINIIDNSISTIDTTNTNYKMNNIHSNLKINYGTFKDELPEQKMAINYLKGHEKVLEIGGNIGRNSLVIASILDDDKNLVSLESDEIIAQQLTENRDMNNLKFHIENSALSNRKLIQRGWDTKPSDILENGYKWVNTITLKQLKEKYNIDFDTLVLDCEGAFYYILMDMPEILNNIKLIIMENDYRDITHKKYIDEVLLKNNFYRDYVEIGGWGPCYNCFFEVWKKL